jgi:hypothetical protein
MPAHDDIPDEPIKIHVGEAFRRYLRVKSIERVQLTSDLGSGTTLPIKPDHPPLASGDKMLFGGNLIFTLAEACVPGDETLVVAAFVGRLKQGDYGQKLIGDLSGYSPIMVVLRNPTDDNADALLTITPTVADDAYDTAASGKCDVFVLADTRAHTSALEPGNYYWSCWRNVSLEERPVGHGPFIVEAAGNI